MSVISSDIVVYGSLSMPEDDLTNDIGGGIDLATQIVFTDIDVAGTVEVLSDVAGDTTQQITLTGRSISGVIKAITVNLSGTTVVPVAQTFERFMKIELDGVAVGNVTVRKTGNAGDLFVFAPDILTIRKPFYNVSAAVSGGAERKFYEKLFIRNDNAVFAMTDAQIAEQSDPGVNIAFDLESTLDGSDTNGAGNNRLIKPVGYPLDSVIKDVANAQDHDPLSAQGIWIEMTLAADASPAKNTYTLRELGKTI